MKEEDGRGRGGEEDNKNGKGNNRKVSEGGRGWAGG